MAVPVPDHADLAEREGDEDADDVELDEAGGVGAVEVDEDRGGAGQQHDAVGERQAVAAGVQLARQVAVLGEDRAEQREAVVGGVGGQEQHQGGGGGEDDERERAVAEDRCGDLRDDRVLGVAGAERLAVVEQVLGGVLGHPDVGGHGQADDAAEHGDGQAAHEGQGGRGVLGLRLAEGGDAVGDRLDAGERGAAGGEGPQQQEDQGEAGQAALLGVDGVVGGGGLHGVAQDDAADHAPDDHDEDAGDEDVGRDREELARLLDAAQVHQRQQHDDRRPRTASCARRRTGSRSPGSPRRRRWRPRRSAHSRRAVRWRR